MIIPVKESVRKIIAAARKNDRRFYSEGNGTA